MMPSTHFQTTLAKSQLDEAELVTKGCFSKLRVRDATREDERKGIDFFVEVFGKWVSVELKADRRSAQTGNFFVEHTLKDHGRKTQKQGWLHTCTADLLVVFDGSRVFFTTPGRLRHCLVENAHAYATAQTHNPDRFDSEGYLVPKEAVTPFSTLASHQLAEHNIHWLLDVHKEFC